MSGLTFQDDLHIIAKRGDNYVNFQAARQDASSPISYSAWLAATGEYIIMEQNNTNSNDIILKYFHSKDSINSAVFQTDWNARDTLTYTEYDALFG